ncbi:MAG TPA: proline dehydrogenase family protein [Acidimicrobiales bacterium]|nr:proline dehydrogenase family protein [Acidimicrobiales bacterium]
MLSPADRDVTALARTIADLGEGEKANVYKMSWWSERMLGYAMSHPSFRTQLFRFVDVFPATTGDADVLRHVDEYFEGTDAPRVLELGIDVADHLPMGDRVTAAVARRNIERMARQFIVGQTPGEAVAGLHQLWRHGSAFTVDLLGEKTLTEAEADRYAARVDELIRALLAGTASWAPDGHLERDDRGPLPRANISIKPTALSSKYAPLTRDEGLAQARARLMPLLRLAADEGAFVWFDMESYDIKDLTLELFRSLVEEPSLAHLHTGVVLQAYLKECRLDLADLVAWAHGLDRPTPVGVRLVKGAYWDAETITAHAEGWPVPVFLDKDETDASFERCTRLLHDHHDTVRAAFGSHNLRSLAYAVSYARANGIPDTGYELQMLYGMAEPIQAAIRRLGLRLRIYAPVGELVPGMAYLVRRLLENTSNESFVRQRFAEGREIEELIAPPQVDKLPDPEVPTPREPTDAHAVVAAFEDIGGGNGPLWTRNAGGYRPEPPAEWRRNTVRTEFAAAVAGADPRAQGRRPIEVPAVIAGERVSTAGSIASVDPGDPECLVATSASCQPAEADAAVEAAMKAWPAWRRAPAVDRAAVLFRAADWMRTRRATLAALEVFEAGKPWAEADGDICEAIDFCEYYGRQMLRLDRGGEVASPPGESNWMHYQGKGIGVVIAPWNFPLAIPTGMVVAALVAGNAVVLKPAEQTPATAYRLVEALEAGGLPPGVLNFLPGVGEEVGARLVEHPDVSFIVFTGSKAVGLAINQTAAVHGERQRHVKRVVAEMGGKNALIVDADADLDQAVPAIASSAFGYAGQKCSAASRLVVLDAVYDELVGRLVGHSRELRVGHPREMAVKLGPVIDEEAWTRVRSHVDRAGAEGTVLLGGTEVPREGWFIGPTIVGDIALDSSLARDEIFGPVLTVLRAEDLEHAVSIANDTGYALTSGIFSRSPTSIAYASAELRGGNVYVNRSITGAVVGRQPFGGYGMSGVGSKAGGPDYLLQFLDPRVVTENTMRQGFAPDDVGEPGRSAG